MESHPTTPAFPSVSSLSPRMDRERSQKRKDGFPSRLSPTELTTPISVSKRCRTHPSARLPSSTPEVITNILNMISASTSPSASGPRHHRRSTVGTSRVSLRSPFLPTRSYSAPHGPTSSPAPEGDGDKDVIVDHVVSVPGPRPTSSQETLMAGYAAQVRLARATQARAVRVETRAVERHALSLSGSRPQPSPVGRAPAGSSAACNLDAQLAAAQGETQGAAPGPLLEELLGEAAAVSLPPLPSAPASILHASPRQDTVSAATDGGDEASPASPAAEGALEESRAEEPPSASPAAAEAVMARLLLSYAQAAATRVKTVLPLSEADRVRADEVRASTPRGAVLYSSPLCEVSGEKVQALRDGGWLNDDLVNGYMSLVLDRARAEYGNAPAAAASPRCSVPPRQRLRVHAFSSGFFTQLLRGGRYDYAGVARWSKRQRVAIHELDLLLVPCHVNGNHWTLCAADFRRGVVAYLDSLGGRPALYGEALARYLRDEAAKIDDPAAAAAAAVREWRVTFPAGPAQENCFDCGVFVCQAAKALAQGTPLAPDDDEDAAPKELRLLDSLYGRRRAPPAWSPPYGQADMRALRQRMALEFAARKLL